MRSRRVFGVDSSISTLFETGKAIVALQYKFGISVPKQRSIARDGRMDVRGSGRDGDAVARGVWRGQYINFI